MSTTPPPRPNTPLIDKQTGLMAKEWFRFISLFFTGAEQTAESVIDNTAEINTLTALTAALTALTTALTTQVAGLELGATIPPLQPQTPWFMDKDLVPQGVRESAIQDLFAQASFGTPRPADPFGILNPPNTPAHIITRPTNPSIVAGPGSGTSPTVGVSGNDVTMQVVVTTGTGAVGTNSEVATITYGVSFPSTPCPVFSPANDNAAALSGASAVFMEGGSASTLVITSGASALSDSTTYIWNVTTTGQS